MPLLALSPQLFLFLPLHVICRGVDFIISASSANVISLSSSFNFNCFCKGGVAPPISSVPILNIGLNISDFESMPLLTSWLVPETSSFMSELPMLVLSFLHRHGIILLW